MDATTTTIATATKGEKAKRKGLADKEPGLFLCAREHALQQRANADFAQGLRGEAGADEEEGNGEALHEAHGKCDRRRAKSVGGENETGEEAIPGHTSSLKT